MFGLSSITHLKLPRVIIILLVLVVSLNFRTENRVFAQDSQTVWSGPTNISQSGSAKNPFLLVDVNNEVLAVWEDDFLGFQSSALIDGKWDAPKSFPMPFDQQRMPSSYQFLNGNNGKVYLFWIDNLNRLFFSTEDFSSVTKIITWSEARPIAQNVDKIYVAQAGDGSIHLVYLVGEETTDLSVGVYYAKITSDGRLLPAVVMDQSQYFRRGNEPLPSQNQTNKQASFTVWSPSPNTGVLFLSWNNPITKRLYLRQSLDAGGSWGDINEFVTPDEGSANLIPQNPLFSQVGSTILFFWQYNQEDVMCKQYYQFSTDQGKTWSERKEPLEDLFGCPEQNSVFPGSNQNGILASVLSSQLYLTVIRNTETESPQVQSDVSGFLDPATYDIIRLQSQQVVLVEGDLYLIGAGIGDISDVWVASRKIDSLYNPQGEAFVWGKPKIITQQQDAFQDIVLLSNIQENIHAFWSQPVGERKNASGSEIYYSAWTDPVNVNPQPILHSDEGKSDHPSVSVDADGRVFIIWSGGKSGDLYFSHSDINRASTALDWVDPVRLPLSSAVTSAILKVGADGSLYIAYIVPLNENRGVYTINSHDRGVTWSDPVTVFDAVQKCEMLEHLAFTISNTGSQHLSWMCSTIPQGVGAYALLYARSADQGKTWSLKQDNLDLDLELVWGEVAGISQDNLQLVWLEYSSDGYRLKYQRSTDDGSSWQPDEEIDALENLIGPLAITSDPGGQLFLLAGAQDLNRISLNTWNWDGETWSFLDSVKLISGSTDQIKSLAAVVLLKGRLGVLYSLNNLSPKTEVVANSLYYLSRPIHLMPAAPSINSASTGPIQESTQQVIAVDQTPVPTEPAVVQPTVDLQAIKQTNDTEISSVVIFIVVGGLAFLAVIIAFFVRQNILFRRNR